MKERKKEDIHTWSLLFPSFVVSCYRIYLSILGMLFFLLPLSLSRSLSIIVGSKVLTYQEYVQGITTRTGKDQKERKFRQKTTLRSAPQVFQLNRPYFPRVNLPCGINITADMAVHPSSSPGAK